MARSRCYTVCTFQNLGGNCRDEFLELLDKAKFERGVDTLILAGDLVDKGPYSIEARMPLNTRPTEFKRGRRLGMVCAERTSTSPQVLVWA